MIDLLDIGFDPEADMPSPRTTEEIDSLKANWIADPNWDIEDTEGFEYHYMELRRWREVQEEELLQRKEAKIAARADQLGFSVTQMMFIEGLEQQIRDLAKRVASLEEKDN